MSKPRTKGPMIGFRLPLEADAELRRRAENDGVSVSEWLERKLAPQLVTPTYSEPIGKRRDDDVPTNFKK